MFDPFRLADRAAAALAPGLTPTFPVAADPTEAAEAAANTSPDRQRHRREGRRRADRHPWVMPHAQQAV